MKTVCVDFDGVIHDMKSWEGPAICIGGVVSGAREFLQELLQRYEVVICSSRAVTLPGKVAIERFLLLKVGLEKRSVERIKITSEKLPAILYIDDRGYRFDGVFPTIEYIEGFKPWNRVE